MLLFSQERMIQVNINEYFVLNNLIDWVRAYSDDFLKRFVYLLGYDFRTFEVPLCLSLINPNLTTKETEGDEEGKDAMPKVLIIYINSL